MAGQGCLEAGRAAGKWPSEKFEAAGKSPFGSSVGYGWMRCFSAASVELGPRSVGLQCAASLGTVGTTVAPLGNAGTCDGVAS